ncbi:hypothetical protein [Euhalothece natronophila]|uniref:hypothetical protein n=1 Tax=Euhalothece natronophila TaxID=577489 RepID=UPI001646BDE7|nr:hypothetical protein [Euhalothece natronophila]
MGQLSITNQSSLLEDFIETSSQVSQKIEETEILRIFFFTAEELSLTIGDEPNSSGEELSLTTDDAPNSLEDFLQSVNEIIDSEI